MYTIKYSCYQEFLLFMAGLFIGFLVEKYVAFGRHSFRFSPYLMRIKEGSKFSSESGVT